MKIFTGNANPELAEKIAAYLKMDLGQAAGIFLQIVDRVHPGIFYPEHIYLGLQNCGIDIGIKRVQVIYAACHLEFMRMIVIRQLDPFFPGNGAGGF